MSVRMPTLILSTVILLGCSTPPEQPSTSPPAQPAAPSEVAVRVSVFDDTTSRPPGPRTEAWLRGFGSWFVDMRFGGDVNVLGRKPIDVDQELFVYPDGRDGTEIRIPFRMTRDICPDGCARDTIMVDIYDDRVEVTATALIGEVSQTFDR